MSVVASVSRFCDLVERYRRQAAEWKMYGQHAQARLLETVVKDVESLLTPLLEESVPLNVAAELTDQKERQIQRHFPLASAGNTGEKWKPRFVIRALVDRYGTTGNRDDVERAA